MKYLPYLREATQCQHRQLESLPIMRELLKPDFTLSKYRALLHCHYRVHRQLESRLAHFLCSFPSDIFHWQHFTASSRLFSDLTKLGEPPCEPGPLPPTVPITNLPEALGCCYVLLGAGFGARFIAPRLEQHLGPDTPLSFYRDGQPFLKPLWHQLDRLLAAHASEPAAREACANAARATFSLFFQNFQTISRPEHREVSTP